MTPFSIYIHHQRNQVQCEEICPSINNFPLEDLIQNNALCIMNIYKKNSEVGVGVDR